LQLSFETHLALNKLFGLIIIDAWVMLKKHHKSFEGCRILRGKLFEKRGQLQQRVFLLVNLIHEILATALALILLQILYDFFHQFKVARIVNNLNDEIVRMQAKVHVVI
jgi:hypothetical protein